MRLARPVLLTASTTFRAIRHEHTKVKVTGPAGPGDVMSALGGPST